MVVTSLEAGGCKTCGFYEKDYVLLDEVMLVVLFGVASLSLSFIRAEVGLFSEGCRLNLHASTG
jgi:hypothetical protein